MKSPILLLACGFTLGILIALPGRGTLIVSLSVCAGCLLAACFLMRLNRLFATEVVVLAGFISAGAASAQLFQYRFPADHISHLKTWGMDLGQPVLLQGTLATSPLQMPNGLQFDLEATRVSDSQRVHAATGKVRLRVFNDENASTPATALQLHYGEAIEAWVRLKRPRNDQNPGGFDYRRWMESIQDIYWQGTIKSPQAIRKITGSGPPFLPRLITRVRERLLESIDRLYPPWSVEGRDGAVLKAVLLGDRSSLDSSMIEDFRRSGLYHLLVVAGLHVGLLALLVEGLLRLIRLRETWRVTLLLIFLCIYSSLVEQRAPTLRASLMIGAYLLARFLDRDQPAMNAIGIAALVLLFYRPAWLLDSGFQLSFAAALLIAGLAVPILGCMTEPYRRALGRLQDRGFDLALEPRSTQFRLDVRSFTDWLCRMYPFRGQPRVTASTVTALLRGLIWLTDLVIFSAVLQLGLLLPMTEIFHRVTLAGIGLNAVAVPLMTVLLAVAVPLVILNLFAAPLAALPAKLLDLIMKGLFGLTELHRMPHWLSFRTPAPPLWVACGFTLAIIIAGYSLNRSRRIFGISGAGAIAFIILIALHPFPPIIPKQILQVTELDCGGGEGLFITLPDRTTVLVGAGGGGRRWFGGGDPFRARRWDPGENIISPYLWSRGIKTIDVLFLPETAGDHLSGVASILRNFRVKQFWYGSLPSWAYAATLRNLLAEHRVVTRRLGASDSILLGDSRFDVLWADSPDDLRKNHFTSPVLMRISNPQGSILLAADLSRVDQARVLKADLPMASCLLEASADEVNSKFIARVEPAVILDSSENRKSSPVIGKAMSDRLRSSGLRIFDVSQCGAVTITLQGREISAQSYFPRSNLESQ